MIATFSAGKAQASDAHLAQALVFNAGRLAWRMREMGVTTQQKTSVSDVVTEADRAAERFVSGVLQRLRPDDGVLGEEGAGSKSASGRTWVVDPVDGTYNYSFGSDYWCSALALVEGDPAAPRDVLLGAVHRPAMGYTWFGSQEHSTSRDGTPVTMRSEGPLSGLAVGTYLHPSFLVRKEVRDAWQAVTSRCATMRMLGAGSVDLASVADGTLGLWLQHSVPAWDWLPGRALVEAAGGATATVQAGGVVWRIAGGVEPVAEAKAALDPYTDRA